MFQTRQQTSISLLPHLQQKHSIKDGPEKQSIILHSSFSILETKISKTFLETNLSLSTTTEVTALLCNQSFTKNKSN